MATRGCGCSGYSTGQGGSNHRSPSQCVSSQCVSAGPQPRLEQVLPQDPAEGAPAPPGYLMGTYRPPGAMEIEDRKQTAGLPMSAWAMRGRCSAPEGHAEAPCGPGCAPGHPDPGGALNSQAP